MEDLLADIENENDEEELEPVSFKSGDWVLVAFSF